MKYLFAVVFAVFALTPFIGGQETKTVSPADKKNFIELLRTLPTDGEFFSNKAVQQAQPYQPVLFALTEKDVPLAELYPFVALSRGFCEFKETREYGINHFKAIQHPVIKLFWAAVLFDMDAASPEITHHLKDALRSPTQAKVLAQIVGPKFQAFRQRVLTTPPDFDGR